MTDEQKQKYKDHQKEYRKNITNEKNKKIEIIKKNLEKIWQMNKSKS